MVIETQFFSILSHATNSACAVPTGLYSPTKLPSPYEKLAKVLISR
ncbi:hypothetical protein SCG7086_AS_00010 [Chlamydiales bacterium SCGC AG-110-P3]|nr:hypothetical protein SCG7086_AS_00010 [Chlamydiales bacterium SCGC AG-110-P3]